jgi:MoaA/NifB/PqqE/SkfB family radical SAM enzyme
MDKTYCSGIDTGLFVYVNGGTKVCCGGSYDFGSVRQQPVKEIFNSQKFIEVRAALHNNQQHDYCKGCYDIEKIAPGSSQMSAFNDQFPAVNGDRRLKLIDIRWSNVCNLTCRYCNVNDSSEWRKLHGLSIESVNRDYTESLFEEVLANRDTIECAYLLGGEPLMQKHNERLLSIIRAETKIDLLTNLAVSNLANNKIYQSLQRFPNVLWNLSFDNVGDRFEYVRQGAQWATFTDNLKRICDDFGPGRVTFHPVYTLWNAHNLEEYYEFAAKQNFRVNWQIALPKIDPKGFESDGFLTFGHKRSIIERAIQEIDQVNVSDPVLQGIKDSLINDTEVADKSVKFLDWTTRMEQFMPPARPFAELWPELNTLLCE